LNQKIFSKFNLSKTLYGIIFFVMKTPKKPINKSKAEDPENDIEDSYEGTSKKKSYDDDDDDLDMPLDDLDSFDSFGSDDDDDDY